MEPTERIALQEQRLDRAQATLSALEQAWDNYLAVQDDFAQLDAYLGSPEWLADRKADTKGKLPPKLRRGVLSEDAIWNLLQYRKELLKDIQASLANMD